MPLNEFHSVVKSNLKAGGIQRDLKLLAPWLSLSVCPTSGHEEVMASSHQPVRSKDGLTTTMGLATNRQLKTPRAELAG